MIDALPADIIIPLSPCGGSGYYDPAHGVCAPYEPAYPPPFYHRHDNASGGRSTNSDDRTHIPAIPTATVQDDVPAP